jgi:uncharacterized RDD family membrane protein YckC
MTGGEAFGRRLGAHMLDGLIIGAIASPLAIGLGVFAGLSAARSGSSGEGMVQGVQVLAQLLQFAIAFIYYGLCGSAWGQTLGKRAVGLRLVGPDGGNPSFFRAGFRDTLGKLVSGCAIFLGFLAVLWDRDQKAWHDHLFGTEVVRM